MDSRESSFTSGCSSRYWSTSFQTVGTAPDMVGRLAWMKRTIGSACSQRSGMHSDAPFMRAAYARPQALAWNIGTIGRIRSWLSMPLTLPVLTASECSQAERWL